MNFLDKINPVKIYKTKINGDKIQIDCSVADKLSGTLSIMEIT